MRTFVTWLAFFFSSASFWVAADICREQHKNHVEVMKELKYLHEVAEKF